MIGIKSIVFIFSKASILKKLFFIVILGIFPLGINCMYLLIESSSIHTLVMYGFVCVYALLFVFIETISCNLPILINHRLNKSISTVAVLSCFGIIISNIYLGNEVSLKLQLDYENSHSFYTSLVTQIKSRPDFDTDTRIALIGTAKELVYPLNEFENAEKIIGVNMDVNIHSRDEFIKYYTGFKICNKPKSGFY